MMWPCVVGARAMGQAGPCGLGLSGCSLPGGVRWMRMYVVYVREV